ncbi:MAG: phosphatase PAP2 family protein [Rhodothermia bacterium]|nr:phosphatase PAP2 family protein [Rhodothermia bacterium]
MVAADRSAWPGFIGVVPVAWVLAAIHRDRTDVRAALSIAMSEGAAGIASMGLKRLVRRPRPYTTVPAIVARSAPHRDGRARDPHSFPSGHAALSFSLATAVALESERWYVTVPVFMWASAVSVSRVWLGVHYPTDVLAGAALGGGMAIAMHALARSLIGDENDHGVRVMQMTFVRVGF